MSSSSSSLISTHNFHAVPRHIPTLLSTLPHPLPTPPPLTTPYPIPTSPLAQSVNAYALQHLPKPTYHHSLRAYNYGLVIADMFFPTWRINRETYFLACVFHDIGTIPANIETSLLSFEFQGGIIAYTTILATAATDSSSTGTAESVSVSDSGSIRAQAEAVAEAVIRHQDIDDIGNGMITQLGSLLQLATLYDNAGRNEQLVSDQTLAVVVDKWPRLGWSGCFKDVIRNECVRKPWSHTTKIGEKKFMAFIEENEKGNALD